jgi:hypothetical protein
VEELDLRVGDGALEHDAGGAEVFGAVDDRDLGGEAGEEDGFFHGGVAAADDGDLLAGGEEAVAGGAGADAEADEGLLGGKVEPAGARSDAMMRERVWTMSLPRVRVKGVGGEVDGGEVGHAELGAEAGGLLLHVLDELGTLDAFGPAGKVFDEGGDGELAAGLVAFEDEGLEVGAGGVDGGGEACAAGAEDDGVADFVRDGHRDLIVSVSKRCKAGVGWDMADLVLVYGLRLLPADEIEAVQAAPIKLKNGHDAQVTMHIVEGSREQIEAQLRHSIDAFFDFYPEI